MIRDTLLSYPAYDSAPDHAIDEAANTAPPPGVSKYVMSARTFGCSVPPSPSNMNSISSGTTLYESSWW